MKPAAVSLSPSAPAGQHGVSVAGGERPNCLNRWRPQRLGSGASLVSARRVDSTGGSPPVDHLKAKNVFRSRRQFGG